MYSSIWKDFRFIAIVDAIASIISLVCGQWLTAIVWFTAVCVAGVAAYCIKKMTAELEEIKERMRWRDPDYEMPDNSIYDWVLIKVKYSDGFVGLPQMGQFRSDGYWHSKSYDDIVKFGESFERMCDCKVIGWRPIE